ncbi:MAG TPA: hypothetical protein DDY87_06095 [Clostridiales bacterium]|nr:hypothetical protein [Clostridiales bacterium]
MLELRPTDPEFVRVWSRVNKPKNDAADTEPAASAGWAEFLEGRLETERQRVRDYRALALQSPLTESRSRVRALGAARFFQTGAADFNHTPKGAANRYPTRAEAIQALYQSEHAAEADYRRAAEICTDATLAGVFLRCAQSCQNGRLALWRIIENAQLI